MSNTPKKKIHIEKVEINKTPTLCASTEDLRAGDILIFSDRGNIVNPGKRRFDFGAYFARKAQGKMNEPGGHKESVHAGVIVRDETGALKLAHLIGDGFHLDDIDPASEKYSRYFSRTTHIYRPRKMQEALAKNISQLAQDLDKDTAKKHVGIKWKFLVAFWSTVSRMVTSLKLRYTNPEETHFPHDLVRTVHQIAGSSICSRFVADAVISACTTLTHDDKVQNASASHSNLVPLVSGDDDSAEIGSDESEELSPKRNYRMRYMNTASITMPKTLQAYLWRNRRYDYLIMPERKFIKPGQAEAANRDLHREFCQDFIAVVKSEAAKMMLNFHPSSLYKGQQVYNIINKFEHATYHNPVFPVLPDDMERVYVREEHKPQVDAVAECIKTMKELAPHLRRNARGNCVNTPAYKRVMAYLKEQGIYKEYIENEYYDRRDGKISELAEAHYHYTKPQAKFYSRYRGLGFSDTEAKFEVNPKASFGDWYKISPVRNTLLTVTGIGFFAWVLPRGLSRAHEVRNNCKARNFGM